MYTMYSNIAKTRYFPLARKVSSKPSCLEHIQGLKPRSLLILCHTKPPLNRSCAQVSTFSHVLNFNPVMPIKTFVGIQYNSVGIGSAARGRSILGGVRLRGAAQCCFILRARKFSDLRSQSGARAAKSLPWLRTNNVKEADGLKKRANAKSSRSLWEESVENMERGAIAQSAISSWDGSRKRVTRDNDTDKAGSKDVSGRTVGAVEDKEGRYGRNRKGGTIEESEVVEEENEVVDDPRWDKIQHRFKRFVGTKARTEKPGLQRWTKQENWGRNTWKEATESSLPKIVGEGVYGVGPVLAALSAARREFYALYVQDGLDISGNNKKKKDKKGFEKVLRMAEKIGLSIKEVSKHDLNMIIDNRPHQGLVLDASPLEMVKIMELDPVFPEDEKNSVWVALDEVTDPQNLGAIIRSAYFFGASGVVLCAKNSAPLSGVVSKASAGSLELMELRYCKNMMQFLVSSADNGWRVIGGSVSSKSVPVRDILPGAPTILVLGSEGTGLRPLVERSCTQLVRIPGNIPVDVTMEGNDDMEAQDTNPERSIIEFQSFLAVESLNVSVAAGVLLHHFTGSGSSQHDEER